MDKDSVRNEVKSIKKRVEELEDNWYVWKRWRGGRRHGRGGSLLLFLLFSIHLQFFDSLYNFL